MADLSAHSMARNFIEQRKQQSGTRSSTDTAHGSAAWASPQEVYDAHLFERGLVFFGELAKHYLYYDGTGHCLSFGPTGSGKGVSVVVPNLLLYPGSVVCIDPKGAIAAVTAARRRALGNDVILLDPFEAVESAMIASGNPEKWDALPRSSYNPFSILDPSSRSVVDDARLLAASLIVQENDKNRYFSDSARMVLECMILFLLAVAGKNQLTFENLFDLAFSTKEKFAEEWLPTMRDCDAFGGHVSHLTNQIENLTGDGGAAVWSTLHRSLNLVKSPNLLPSLQTSALDFSKLKLERPEDKPTTVYLVLPAKRLNTHGVWLRLMLSALLNQLSDARPSRYPVLFLIDECASLGRLEILETAVGLMRGYGLKLWLIFQDLSQLKSVYPDRWSSFISNAGVKQFFNVNDTETADYVSGYLGSETRYVRSDNVQQMGQLPGSNISAAGRPLLTPDEVRRLGEDQQILLYERMKPILANKVIYYENDELNNWAAPDPYVAGT